MLRFEFKDVQHNNLAWKFLSQLQEKEHAAVSARTSSLTIQLPNSKPWLRWIHSNSICVCESRWLQSSQSKIIPRFCQIVECILKVNYKVWGILLVEPRHRGHEALTRMAHRFVMATSFKLLDNKTMFETFFQLAFFHKGPKKNHFLHDIPYQWKSFFFTNF